MYREYIHDLATLMQNVLNGFDMNCSCRLYSPCVGEDDRIIHVAHRRLQCTSMHW